MLRGIYISATSMMTQQKQMEKISNNIANVETTGYKKDHLVCRTFEDVLISRINDPSVVNQSTLVGPLTFGTRVDRMFTNFETGSFEHTERSTDLALGDGTFFVVQTPIGERYTRAGDFRVSASGYLTDASGNLVLGTSGPLRPGKEDFTVDGSGRMYASGAPVDQIRIVTVDNPENLRKEGSNLYFAFGDAGVRPAENAVIQQGFLETSNVDVGREMVEMLTVYRAYESNQKMIGMMDETLGKAVNEIGRVR